MRKFSAFYRPWRFITVFTTAHHFSLSWARSIHSTTSQPIYLISILVLLSHLSLGVQIGLFLLGFLTKNLHAPLLSPLRAICPTHLILLYFTIRSCTNHEALHYAVSSSTLLPRPSWSQIVFSILFSNTLTYVGSHFTSSSAILLYDCKLYLLIKGYRT